MLGSMSFMACLLCGTFARRAGGSYTPDMELLGRVDRGVIVPQGETHLPEGAMVRIVYEPEAGEPTKKSGRRVTFPLVESDKPGSLHLTNEMIAQILDEDDLSS
jgi:hypothetical protein